MLDFELDYSLHYFKNGGWVENNKSIDFQDLRENSTITKRDYYISDNETYSHEVYHLENVKLVNNKLGGNNYRFSGNSYILWLGHHNIFHILADAYGQALYMKDIIPDLNIIPVLQLTEINTDETSMITKEIAEVLGIDISNIISARQSSELSFENLYFFNPYQNDFLSNAITGDRQQEIPRDPNKQYNSASISAIAFMLKLLDYVKKAVDQNITQDDNTYPKKIFLNIPEVKYSEDQRHLKTYLKQEDYDTILKYAKSNGFTVINPWELTFREQVLYSRNAQEILTIPSSNAIHAMWGGDKNRFIYFNPYRFHFFAFDYIIRHYAKNNEVIYGGIEDILFLSAYNQLKSLHISLL